MINWLHVNICNHLTVEPWHSKCSMAGLSNKDSHPILTPHMSLRLYRTLFSLQKKTPAKGTKNPIQAQPPCPH